MTAFRPVRLTDEQRIDWLRLIRTENVGPRTFRTLINQFGGAKRAIEHLPDIARRGGRGALNVVSRDDAAKEIAAAARLGVKYVGLGEIEYPTLLRETDDAPPLLAIRGDVEALAKPAVARETETQKIAELENEPPLPDETLRTRLQNLLGAVPVSVDDLLRETKAAAGAMQMALLELELAGRIERHGGGMVSLI